MQVLKTLRVDILDKQSVPHVYANQGEANSRIIRFILHEGASPWNVPDGFNVYIAYKKPDGFGGVYDSLPGGPTAITVNGNIVDAILTEQVLTTVGDVRLSLIINEVDNTIATFPIIIQCQENPGVDAIESEDYFSLSAAIKAAENAAPTLMEMVEKAGKAVYMPTLTWDADQGVYLCNVSIADLNAAYANRKSIVCYLGGRALTYVGSSKDEHNVNQYFFRGNSSTGSQTQTVRIYAPEGDEAAKAHGTVHSEPVAADLSAYSALGRVGVIGDSLSTGVEDGDTTTIENRNQSWVTWLERATGNPHEIMGFGGATTSTWIRDKLASYLDPYSFVDAYILALGFNDCRDYREDATPPYVGCVPLGSMIDITGADEWINDNGDSLPYGSYYFNVEKILRKIHEANPAAPIIVLTNPDFTGDEKANPIAYNNALIEIVNEYGEQYNAHLIDLYSLYGSVYQELEQFRGKFNHFTRQIYAYMGQIIATAISRDIVSSPDAYGKLAGAVGYPHYSVLMNHEQTLDEMDEAIKDIQDKLNGMDVLPSGGGVFEVHITKTGENTDTSDKTFAEIIEAKHNNKIVQCKYAQYILPLCWLDDLQAIFGGATGNVTIFISVDQNNGVQVKTSTLAIESQVPTKEEFDTLKNSVSAIDDTIGAGTPFVASAAVGQTVVVKAVDESGKPTEWEAADMASGGEREWELYDTITVSEDISNLSIGNLTDATSLYAKGYKELYIVYSMNPHATTPITELRIQVNSVSGGTYAGFPNYAPAAGKIVNGFLHIFIMPMARHSVILANQSGVYAAAGIIKTAPYDDRAIGLYDKISMVTVVSNVGAGSTFTIYGR